jgi:hypothetical protein
LAEGIKVLIKMEGHVEDRMPYKTFPPVICHEKEKRNGRRKIRITEE